jgi:glucose-1-phosphate cytidylyltransferase
MLTYGDGLIDLNINELVQFHKTHEAAVTMTSAQPDGRFGSLEISGNKVVKFQEKPKGDGSWINAGYFVCDKDIFKYIKNGDDVVLEQEPLKLLAKDNQLFTYKHEGFWMPMDTLRDKIKLEKIWKEKNAPWK